ncbi:ketoacyl-synt-domain-containing protein [Dorcoceras hygrometricum]|uniref:Ketoacyl-synt-domain-containing protein n=1 Tax=Dorcoceras hygrometricum TaxID=472368 RepID=A0A2Z6ZVC2_9LAMI|nr:ketoacyl-synt-domain-containing protein [Dorcoceras hygrometricum]
MAQYQILARKLLGLPGTGPKQTLGVKNSVATQPRVRRTAAHRRLHSVHHTAARCARHRVQRLRTRAASYAHTARRWAAGAARHLTRQSRTVAGHRHCSCTQIQCPPRADTACYSVHRTHDVRTGAARREHVARGDAHGVACGGAR